MKNLVMPDAEYKADEDLLPCPHCGSEQVYIERRAGATCNQGVYCIGCDSHYSGSHWNDRARPTIYAIPQSHPESDKDAGSAKTVWPVRLFQRLWRGFAAKR